MKKIIDLALRELIELMPPTELLPFEKVDWEKLEERVGLRYPKSFKEYVSVYGGSSWCDWWHPFFNEAEDSKSLDEFMETMSYHITIMRDKDLCKSEEETALPLYPERGGLLPFLIDFDNISYCCWKTTNANPDKWPVAFVIGWDVVELRGITMAGMILEWLRRSTRMRKVWGDVKDVEEHEICFNRR